MKNGIALLIFRLKTFINSSLKQCKFQISRNTIEFITK
jgi:hypothetical protein